MESNAINYKYSHLDAKEGAWAHIIIIIIIMKCFSYLAEDAAHILATGHET